MLLGRLAVQETRICDRLLETAGLSCMDKDTRCLPLCHSSVLDTSFLSLSLQKERSTVHIIQSDKMAMSKLCDQNCTFCCDN